MFKRLFAASTTLGLLVSMTLLASPATALDRGYMGAATKSGPDVVMSYPAIVGELAPDNKPAHPDGYRLKAQYVVKRCRDTAGAYCDAMSFRIKNEGVKDLHYVRITLTWADPKNNMDFFVWPDAETKSNTADCCGAQIAQANSATAYPESVKMGEPSDFDNPKTATIDESLYWITVVNYSGINSGYTLKIEWDVEDLGTFPVFNRGGKSSGSGFGFGAARPGSRPRPPTGFNDSITSDSTEETEIIKVPGPDGELIDVEVPVLVQGETRRKPDQRSPIVPVFIGLLILSGALLGYFMVKNRRNKAAEVY